jgi:serine/threonine protein kinase
MSPAPPSRRAAIQRGDDAIANRTIRAIYALGCARALAYLHSKGLAHMDFKSANVLLAYREHRPVAKVAGYGLSPTRVASYTPGVTTSRSTMAWMAPEVIRNPAAVSRKADVYSFGIVLWELWALKSPYADREAHQRLVTAMVGTDEVVRPALPATEAPGPGWREVMEMCWEEDPSRRPEFE